MYFGGGGQIQAPRKEKLNYTLKQTFVGIYAVSWCQSLIKLTMECAKLTRKY